MQIFNRQDARQPLWVIAALWPLVMIVQLLPGLPRPVPTHLLWRQETWLALLMVASLALLARRGFPQAARWFAVSRSEAFLRLSLMLFFAWSVGSAVWSENAAASVNHSLLWSVYIFFFLLMCRVAESPRLLRASFVTLAIVICSVGVLCAAEFQSGSHLFRYYIGLGEPFAVAASLFCALALDVRRKRTAILCGATGIMAWVTTTLTLERAPTIAALAGLLFVAAWAVLRRDERHKRLRRSGMLLAALTLASLIQVTPSFAPQSGAASVFSRLSQTSSNDESGRIRFLWWGIALEMWRANPLVGVGGNNYEVAFPEARAQFARHYPDSPLIAPHEDRIVQRTHNEYLQVLAEFGAIGFALFIIFGAAVLCVMIQSLRRAPNALTVGASAGMLAFALSSGASSVSFRFLESGLLFFFAAAITTRFASPVERRDEPARYLSPLRLRAAGVGALALAVVLLSLTSVQFVSATLRGAGQASDDAGRAERYYRASLRLNPFDAGANYDYGLQLFRGRRASEAVPRLRYATAHGFNSSVCYAYLAAAEAGSGDLTAAEQTLKRAVEVYPASTFLRVRHAAALVALHRDVEAEMEYNAALTLDARAARGWWHLINRGADAATLAAHSDRGIARPGELLPEDAVLAVLAENERRSDADAVPNTRMRAPLAAAQ